MEHQEIADNNFSKVKEISFSNLLLFFVLSYFFLYCNSGQFLTSFLFEWIYTIVVPPFASLFGEAHLTRVNYTGSGDTPFNYYQVFFMLFVAFVASFFLLFFMRKEKTVKTFLKVVFMLVRYYLIYLMIIYGLSKVFYLQFQYPNDYLLERTLGDMSPMGLMWTFMGYSKGYTMFAGWLEFLAGVFLVFRRTTVLGALMTFGVMLNVFMMNMCYDVPVKLLSFHMTLMGLFLLFPIRKELFGFLFSRDKVVRGKLPFFDYKDTTAVMFWLKIGLLAFMVIRMSSSHYKTYQKRGATSTFSTKHEVIDHKIFDDSGQEKELYDNDKWKSITSFSPKRLRIEFEDNRVRGYDIIIDEEVQTLKIKRDAEIEYETLRYIRDTSGIYHFNGTMFNDSLSIRMKKSDKDFLLKTRGFHWMQDQAFNR